MIQTAINLQNKISSLKRDHETFYRFWELIGGLDNYKRVEKIENDLLFYEMQYEALQEEYEKKTSSNNNFRTI